MKTTHRQPPTRETLSRRYHTIATRLNMGDDERKAFLSAWGVESSKDLTAAQLEEVCRALADFNFDNSLDKWRKRVIASVFGWFKLVGKPVEMDYVKGVACRAAGYKSFNAIPADKLRSLYHTFTHKSKIFRDTGELLNDELEQLAFNN